MLQPLTTKMYLNNKHWFLQDQIYRKRKGEETVRWQRDLSEYSIALISLTSPIPTPASQPPSSIENCVKILMINDQSLQRPPVGQLVKSIMNVIIFLSPWGQNKLGKQSSEVSWIVTAVIEYVVKLILVSEQCASFGQGMFKERIFWIRIGIFVAITFLQGAENREGLIKQSHPQTFSKER